jgi:hypothetical protein
VLLDLCQPFYCGCAAPERERSRNGSEYPQTAENRDETASVILIPGETEGGKQQPLEGNEPCQSVIYQVVFVLDELTDVSGGLRGRLNGGRCVWLRGYR